MESPLATGNWEAVRVFALYDLEQDPFEEHDVASEFPAVVRDLKAKLATIVGASQAAATTELAADEQALVEQQLKALGYL